jgi:DNA-binding XRE family transcriptional regulator
MQTAEFKRARKQLGYNPEQMARALGLGKHGKRTIERIEAGGTITGPMALAVEHLTLQDALDKL